MLVAVALLSAHAALYYSDVAISSETARRVLLQQIKNITQRDARIDGEVLITVSLQPQLLAERIHVLDTQGSGPDDFITVSEARVQISLLSLLSGTIRLEEISAAHAVINLIRQKNGSRNWLFDHPEQPKKTGTAGDGITETAARRRITIHLFELTDVTINYHDESAGQEVVSRFSELRVDLTDTGKPHAEIKGTVQGYPYDIVLEAEPLEKLTRNEAWKLVGAGRAAHRKTRIDAVLQLNQQDVTGAFEIEVEDVDLGLLLEHTGIISVQAASSEIFRLSASFQGDSLSSLVEDTDFSVQLQRGYLRWKAISNDETRQLDFDKAELTASMNNPSRIHLDGRLSGELIRLDLLSNTLSDFIDKRKKLDVDLAAHIAGSDIGLKGALDLPLDMRLFRLDISLQGEDLEELNHILNSELPPFNNYSLNGSISSNEKGIVVKAADATIGDTHFFGSIIIDMIQPKPLWTINLDSRQLQLRNFEFIDENLASTGADRIKTSIQAPADEGRQQAGYRLKRLVSNPAMHFDLNVNADRVLAGGTALGGFSLKMKLRDDTLIVQDARLDVPGGKITTAASFSIDNDLITGAFKLDADKFESGTVVAYLTHGTRQGGKISAHVDLKLGGRRFDRLFDHATGKLDLAFWPRNIGTKVFDIWATNLFLLILPEIRKDHSRMNCMVALMSIDDGVMKEDFFAIDTTKVWITGNINVDFANEHISLSLYPRSKTARLFALQAPIRAEGTFDDIDLVTNPVDLIVAYLSFITSPLHVPARRIFDDVVPEDASAACEKFFDRAYVEQLKAKLEAEEQQEIEDLLNGD
jgi:uncharacterized protein involved in outer membrane biogenesis